DTARKPVISVFGGEIAPAFRIANQPSPFAIPIGSAPSQELPPNPFLPAPAETEREMSEQVSTPLNETPHPVDEEPHSVTPPPPQLSLADRITFPSDSKELSTSHGIDSNDGQALDKSEAASASPTELRFSQPPATASMSQSIFESLRPASFFSP